MVKLNKHTKIIAVIVVLLVAFAAFLRIMGRFIPAATEHVSLTTSLRSIIYTCIFFTWGISVRQRIIQTQVRKYLTFISSLMVFWVLERTIKFLFAHSPFFLRYLWYSYYLPLLFIPLLIFFVALSLGNPEDFRLPRWTSLLYVQTFILLLLVMSNDIHQLVFTFPETPWLDSNNGYGILYLLVVAHGYIYAVAAFIVMVVKCRRPKPRRNVWFPLVPAVILIVYEVLYFFGEEWLRVIAGDATVVHCLMFAAALEGCIQCGLIQSNTHYIDLFRITTIRAKIADDDYNIFLSSTDTAPLSKEIMQQTEAAPVLLDGNIRLSGAPFKGGHVIWSEDVSQIAEIVTELKSVNEQLKEKHTVIQEEYATNRKNRQLIEKKRLYDKVLAQTDKDIDLYAHLSEKLAGATNTDEVRRLAAHIAVVCAYIKRRINLIFLAEENSSIPAEELSICISKDSLPCIRLSGTECSFSSELNSTMSFEQITYFYEAFHTVTMAALDSLSTLSVTLDEQSGSPEMLLRLKCSANLAALTGKHLTVEPEADGWLVTVTSPKGGATE